MSVRTWKEIKWKGIECKKNVEKDYELGIYSQWGYYFAKALITPYKDIKRINSIKKAPEPRGDKIKLRIPRKDYVELAKQLISFVEKNGRMKNYLTYNNKRIRARLYVYMFAKILDYRNNHDDFPKYVDIDYSVFYKPKPKTYKKYGRSTEYGCDNRGQNNGYYCGPHMIQEIIRNLTGKVISQSTLAEVIGTTYDGSDHDGLNTAIAWFNRKYGYNLKVEWKNFSDLGWKGIKKILESDNQDCGFHELYRNTWGHYTNFDKIYDDYIDVHNSLGDSCSSGCYCGYTEERSKSTAESYLNGISQKSVMVVTNES